MKDTWEIELHETIDSDYSHEAKQERMEEQRIEDLLNDKDF